MSVAELIEQADARGLAASGLACLDRCLPLLDGDDDVLRPVWAALADEDASEAGSDWARVLDEVRGTLAGPGASGEDEAVALARRMLADAPAGRSPAEVREWAAACSAASLRVHRLLDPAPDDLGGDAGAGGSGPDSGTGGPGSGGSGPGGSGRDGSGSGSAEGGSGAGHGDADRDATPLVAAELRRQIAVLELLAGHGPAGLRGALDVATEGRRVLRAVVSRRARSRG